MTRLLKLLRSGVLALLVLLLAVATAAVLLRVEIAERLLPRLLAEAGHPGASLDVSEIGLGRAVLRDVRLAGGGGLSARRIGIGYRLPGLLDGRLDAVAVDGLRVRLEVASGGIDWGPLAPLLAPPAATAPPPLRLVGPVRFTDAHLILATPWGDAAATLDGEAMLTDNLGTAVTAQLGLAHSRASLHGSLEAHFDTEGGIRASLEIADGRSTAAVAFAALAGRLDVRGRGLEDVRLSGRLLADDLRAGGLGLGDGRLEGGVEAGRLDVSLVLPGAPSGLQATARVRSPNLAAADPRFEIDGDIATAGLAGDLLPWPDAGLAGRAVYYLDSHAAGLAGLAAAIAGAGQLPPDAALQARLDADLIEVTLAGAGTTIAVRGGLAAEIAGGRLRLRLDDAVDLDIDHPPAGLSGLLVELAPAAGGAPLIKLGPGLADPVEVAATVAAAPAGWPTVAGGVDASLLIDAAGLPFLEDLRAEIASVTWDSPWGEITTTESQVRLGGTLGAFAGRLETTLEAPRLALGGVRAETVRLPLSIDVDATEMRIEARIPGCLRPEVGRLEIAGAAITTAPLELCPAGAEAPLVRLTRGLSPEIEAAAALRPTEVRAVLPAADGRGLAGVAGPLPRLLGRFEIDLESEIWLAEIDGVGGDLLTSPAEVAVEGLDFTLRVDAGGADLALRRARLRDRAAEPRLAPLVLSGDGRLDGTVARFAGRLAAAGEALGVNVKATHDFANAAGRLRVELPTTDIGGAGIEIETVAPLLAGHVTDLDGRIGGAGHLAWRQGEPVQSGGELVLANLAFATVPAEVAGLSGQIAFSSLLPPTTPPGQRLAIGFLDPGLPLADGEVSFELKPGPVLAIERAGWPFAGGRLVSDGAEFALATGFEGATLDVEAVSIEELLQIVAVEDLNGTGQLSGTLPLRIEDGTPTIRGARLSADGGVIRYASAAAAEVLASQGGSAEILARALRDFRYDRLVFTADGPLTGEVTAQVELDGSNPELYDGKPIELNVTLQGDLRPLIQSASVINDLPERIRRQIQGDGNADGER